MGVLPVGLSTGCFYRRSIFEVLPAIRDSGFSHLEICSYPHHLNYRDPEEVQRAAAKMKEYGLQPFSFHAPFAADLDITAPEPERRQASFAEMALAVRAAALLEAKHFVIHPGPELVGPIPGAEHQQRLQNCADILERLARLCTEKGIKMVLENMLPFLLLGRTTDLQWLMDALQPYDPGFCLDTGHGHLAGRLPEITAMFPKQLKMLHAADNWGKTDEHLPPGQGGIDWLGLFANLRELDFQGGLILELSGDDGKNSGEILAAARQARQFLDEITAWEKEVGRS